MHTRGRTFALGMLLWVFAATICAAAPPRTVTKVDTVAESSPAVEFATPYLGRDGAHLFARWADDRGIVIPANETPDRTLIKLLLLLAFLSGAIPQ
jgi:hypothetical protein